MAKIGGGGHRLLPTLPTDLRKATLAEMLNFLEVKALGSERTRYQPRICELCEKGDMSMHEVILELQRRLVGRLR